MLCERKVQTSVGNMVAPPHAEYSTPRHHMESLQFVWSVLRTVQSKFLSRIVVDTAEGRYILHLIIYMNNIPMMCWSDIMSVDARGLHAFVCKFAPGKFARHQAINDVISRAFASALVPATKEPRSASAVAELAAPRKITKYCNFPAAYMFQPIALETWERSTHQRVNFWMT